MLWLSAKLRQLLWSYHSLALRQWRNLTAVVFCSALRSPLVSECSSLTLRLLAVEDTKLSSLLCSRTESSEPVRDSTESWDSVSWGSKLIVFFVASVLMLEDPLLFSMLFRRTSDIRLLWPLSWRNEDENSQLCRPLNHHPSIEIPMIKIKSKA